MSYEWQQDQTFTKTKKLIQENRNIKTMSTIKINKKPFFISDLHIEHSNVIKYDGRPYDGVDQMSEDIIMKWNNVVTNDDVVYYLGDLCMKMTEGVKDVVNRLNGKIHFIKGNHDRLKDIKKLDRFEEIHPYGTEIMVLDETVKGSYQHIVLSHYPILSWNRQHHGSWMLHGHCHQSLTKNSSYDWYYKLKVMDVGCNGINYTPISYDEVKIIMGGKNIGEHH